MARIQLIVEGRTREVEGRAEDGDLWLPAPAVQDALGWQLREEGLCQGDLCIPVRDRAALVQGEELSLRALAAALDRPLALDAEEGAAALGTPAAERAASLASLEAPDFALPDLQGRLHRLSEHRGKKVLLIAYASW